MNAVVFSALDMGLAAGLMLLTALASFALAIGLQRQILWAGGRMVAQLLLISLVLRHLFAPGNGWLAPGLIVIMVLAASYEVWARQRGVLAPRIGMAISGAAIGVSTALVAGFAMAALHGGEGVWQARFLIPVTGIVIGAAMNAASVSLHAFLSGLRRDRAAIEAMLALGRSRFQALFPRIRQAAHAGMIPTLNQMAGAGIITLPGVMSGQLLAGQDPVAAATTQIVLMLLLCVVAALAIGVVLGLALLQITDGRARLRLDRLEVPK